MAPDTATLVRPETPAVSPPPPPPSAEPVRGEPQGAISRNWALVLAVGWPVTVAIATGLEPAPANPDAAVSPIGVLLGLVFMAGLLTAIASAAARRARAPMWSVLLGTLALGLVVACPTTGHHGFGAWWVAELAVYGGMFAVSLAALRSVRR